jgi:anhydro-N-acetylmuramic acid kinase
MSGSSMDGLDIAYCTFEEIGGKWSYQINSAECIPFDAEWKQTLQQLTSLTAKDLILAHTNFGRWMGHAILDFITKHDLEHKVHLIASHGHTVFHAPDQHMTFQLGDGATLAALTKLPVVSDLRNMDIALDGQGAPIVPIGESYLWKEYSCFLNIGGISNISLRIQNESIAFDICPANRVLNVLVNDLNLPYDNHGEQAAKGTIHQDILNELNTLSYYQKPFPKSLANEFGTEIVLPILQNSNCSVQDKLATMCEHIAIQIKRVFEENHIEHEKLLITGGGALNTYLISRIQYHLNDYNIEVVLPDETTLQYKEALVMGLIGILRWREEVNVLSSVTGASRSSVGGALWMGQD